MKLQVQGLIVTKLIKWGCKINSLYHSRFIPLDEFFLRMSKTRIHNHFSTLNIIWKHLKIEKGIKISNFLFQTIFKQLLSTTIECKFYFKFQDQRLFSLIASHPIVNTSSSMMWRRERPFGLHIEHFFWISDKHMHTTVVDKNKVRVNS